MIIWLNGAFGSGKTTAAFELQRRLPGSFVYDPENIGYFLRNNLPQELRLPDFQNYPEWREFNFDLLSRFARELSERVIIVPMTLTDELYFGEIIGRLRLDGAEVRHIILYASRATLMKRLSRRLERGDTWAKRQIERCITAFDAMVTEQKVFTDSLSVDEVVETVAAMCGLELVPDRRGKFRKWWERNLVLLKHVRK